MGVGRRLTVLWTLNAKNDGWTGQWKWEGEPAFQGTPWNGTKKSPLPSVGKAVQDLIAKDLRPACQTHDVCYRSKLKTQPACDMGMLKDMKAICQSTYGNGWFGIERGFCDWRAIQLYNAVMTSYGAMAYGGGKMNSAITADRVWVTDDILSDDEISGCVTIKNTSDRILEFDLQMLSSSGKVLDTEPDASEVNINPNASKELCVSTNGAPESYNDVGPEFTLYVRLDNPDNMSVMGDMIYVWAKKYPRPKRP